MGYYLTQGKQTLSKGHIEAILKILPTRTKRQVQEFWGAVGYCWLWIPGFSEIAKSLYANTSRGNASLEWTETEQQAFEKLN
jgi:hypothetical protein